MSELSCWRLIRSGYLDGALNMALDDALLHAVADGASPPILRLYRWRPAALSLGYAQPVGAGIDLQACRAAGVDIVRRPTGGRAVLHDREVTYAIIAPVGNRFGASVAESYRMIAGALGQALRGLGLAAELVPGRARGRQGQAVCFTAPAQYELLIAGCKVAGCAQKRRKSAFLQHGSIPLDLDLEQLQQLMPAATNEDAGSRIHAIGWLNRFSAMPLAVEAVEDALIGAVASRFGIRFEASRPSAAESSMAERLRAEWYGNPDWTLGGPGWRGMSADAIADGDGD